MGVFEGRALALQNARIGRHFDDEPLAAVVDDVVKRHARELPMEVEGADPSVAASWFRGKVDFPVRVPHLDLQNASFDGAP